jgi:hypothetical protein
MELRQFTEAGVPLLDQLAKQMGITAGEVQKLVSEGKIGFGDVQQALVALTSEGGRFNNLMQNQSQTLNGMISNLKDAWDIFLRGEGQHLLEWAKAFIALAIDIVQNHLPAWIARIEQIVQWTSQHKEVLLIVAGAIVGALVPAVYAAVAAFAAFAVALAPFIIGGAIVGGIVAGVVWIIRHWEMLKAAVQDTVEYILAQADRIVRAYEKVRDVVSKPLKTAANSITSDFKWAASALGFETGGTVPGPRGMPVPIMAHGQETIIPAGQQSTSSGDVYVTINNPVVRNDTDIRAIRDQIDRALRDVLRTHKYAIA